MSNNLALNIEEIKRQKDGLDVLGDIYIHAVLGEKIPSEDLHRLQWYGIYASDENQNSFELKIPLNMGELSLKQLKVLTKISQEFANNSLTFSNEQKVELKDIKIYNFPKIFNLLKEVDLTTFFEAGHTVRRVITCPLNGIDNEQLIDVSSFVEQLDNTFIGNKKYSNMPNKLQFSISGYEQGCELSFTPDVSFNASTDSKNKIIFLIKLCGEDFGYVYPSQLVLTAKAIAKIYRDFGNREDINNSSFEAFLEDWGIVKFYDLLNSSLPFNVKNSSQNNNVCFIKKPRMGIHQSAIEGQSYIGCLLNNHSQKSETISKFTQVLEKYNASKIKITHKGNIIVLDAPSQNANEFALELEKINFNPFV
jgi:sulfite reductase beta subunit-like hemoprotein